MPYSLPGPSRRLRPTVEGWWFILLTIAVGGVAINTGINLLYVILATMLSFIIASGLLCELSVWGVEVSLGVPRFVFCGEAFAVRVTVRNKKRWFASHSLRLMDALPRWGKRTEHSSYVIYVPTRGQVDFTYLARLERRGIHTVHEVEIKSAYPFALFEKSYFVAAGSCVVVYPALGEIRRLPPVLAACQRLEGKREVGAQNADEELLGLRRYRPGDDRKLIHWRTSARTGALMVREFARDEDEGVNLVLETSNTSEAGPIPRDGFELAVSYAATLVHHLAGQGVRVCLAAWPASGEVLTTDGNGSAGALLELLALVEPSGRPESGDGWRAIEERLIPGAPLLVVRWGSPACGNPGCVLGSWSWNITKVLNVRDPEFQRFFVSATAGR